MFLVKLLCHLLPAAVQIPNKLKNTLLCLLTLITIPPPALPGRDLHWCDISSLRCGRSHLAGVLPAICPFVWRRQLICAQQSRSGQPAAPEADLAAASGVKHTDQSLSKTQQHRRRRRRRQVKLIFSTGERLRSSAAVGRECTSQCTAHRTDWNRTGSGQDHLDRVSGGTFTHYLGQDTVAGEATPRLASASKLESSIHVLSPLLLPPGVAGANPSHLQVEAVSHSLQHSITAEAVIELLI